MTIWLDAQLPPQICAWLEDTFGIRALPVRDLGLRDARDREIYRRAAAEGVIVMSKDRDFVDLSIELGAPPHIIWLTFGNTSNVKLREILSATLEDALRMIESGESIVEIGGGSNSVPR